ncbi:MAG: LysR family transcriptional regulator [Pseudomonadota bacterium]
MSLDQKSLELFIRVAALGAIGRAGSEFGLSPTAATQRIQTLEHEVGAQLLHRTTRSVALSADGEVFLEHAKRIIAGFEDALSEMQRDPKSIQGDLRVASSASFGRQHIAPYMAEFLAAHPKVSAQLHLSDSVFDIVENGYDLAIRLGELAPSALKARRIASSPRLVVASPDYLARHPLPATPADLISHNCLIRSDLRTWKFQTPDGASVDAKIAGNFATNLAEAITEAALTGVGIARKCRWEVAEHLQSGALVPVLEDHTVLPEWGIFAVRPPSRQLPPRVRAFTEFLEAKFQKVPALQDD